MSIRAYVLAYLSVIGIIGIILGYLFEVRHFDYLIRPNLLWWSFGVCAGILTGVGIFISLKFKDTVAQARTIIGLFFLGAFLGPFSGSVINRSLFMKEEVWSGSFDSIEVFDEVVESPAGDGRYVLAEYRLVKLYFYAGERIHDIQFMSSSRKRWERDESFSIPVYTGLLGGRFFGIPPSFLD